MAQIEAVVTSLDSKADGGVRELVTIDLTNGSAADVLPTVQRIYTEQSAGKAARPATIYPDASGPRLMVYGSREQALAVRQIVSTLERRDAVVRVSRTIDLGRLAEAQRVLPLAQQLYRDQMAGNPKLGLPDAQLVSDNKTGRVFVTAREDQISLIEDLVSRLRLSSATNSVARETRAVDVGNAAEVQRLQPMVQQLYQDQVERAPGDRSGRRPNRPRHQSGPAHHHRPARACAGHRSDHPAGGPRPGLGRHPGHPGLRSDDGQRHRTGRHGSHSVPWTPARSRLGTIVPDTLIVPDAVANRLVVVGETNELDAVEEIIKKLDKVGVQSAGVRVFRLKSAEPLQVSTILSSALVRYDAYGRPQKRVSIVADAQSRTLIATGDPKELQGLSVIIEQLDSAGAQPERKLKVVSLKAGSAAETAPKLRQLYTDQLRSQPELGTTEILVMIEAPSNQLILAGNDLQLGLLEKILGELQTVAASVVPRQTRIIEFSQAEEMARLLPMIQQLYLERWRDQAPGDPADATFLSDARNARLMVTARTNHLPVVEAVIAQLRGDIKPVARDTRVFDLTTPPRPLSWPPPSAAFTKSSPRPGPAPRRPTRRLFPTRAPTGSSSPARPTSWT